MKKTLCIGIISITASLMGCSDKNIANVNGVDITREDYERTMQIIAATSGYVQNKSIEDIEEYIDGKSESKLKNMIISFMVDNEILYQQAKDKIPQPSEDEINLKYEEVEVAINSNPGYKNKLEQIGINKDYLLREVSKDITIQKYRDEFENNTEVTQNEIENYYKNNMDKFIIEEVNASHILISRLYYEKNQIQKDKAIDILEKIKCGESFENLAKEYSDDKQSGKNGGNLGYFSKNEKNIEFANEAFKLDKNQISQLIETSYGYHIIKVNDKRKVIKNIEESKEDIIKYILSERYAKHIQELNEKSHIKRK